MSASRQVCKEQVQRFWAAALRELPQERAGVVMLIETLARHAASDEHARRIVDRAIESSEFCPRPAMIVQLAQDVPSGQKVPAGCPRCHGEAWVVVERGGISGTKRCDCARGRWHAQKDAERRKAEVAKHV